MRLFCCCCGVLMLMPAMSSLMPYAAFAATIYAHADAMPYADASHFAAYTCARPPAPYLPPVQPVFSDVPIFDAILIAFHIPSIYPRVRLSSTSPTPRCSPCARCFIYAIHATYTPPFAMPSCRHSARRCSPAMPLMLVAALAMPLRPSCAMPFIARSPTVACLR